MELDVLDVFYGKSSSLPWKGAIKDIKDVCEQERDN